MAQINAISNATGQLTIDPGASGDSFIQFNINTTGEFRIGVDDDASDAFKISQGSALGTNDMMIITAAGEITMPLQPAFAAFLGTTDSDVTGNGTSYMLGSGNALTEIFDRGGDFVTTGTFTAPVTGRYVLNVGYLIQQASAANNLSFTVVTSNRTWTSFQVDPSGLDVSGEVGFSTTLFVDMDASDTATTSIAVNGVGADTVDVAGAATNPSTWFTGYLEV